MERRNSNKAIGISSAFIASLLFAGCGLSSKPTYSTTGSSTTTSTSGSSSTTGSTSTSSSSSTSGSAEIIAETATPPIIPSPTTTFGVDTGLQTFFETPCSTGETTMRCYVLTCEWVAENGGSSCSDSSHWWTYASYGSAIPEAPRWNTYANIPNCAYLDDRISSLGLTRLTPAQANEATEWAGRCFPDAASRSYINFITHLANATSVPCPEYPVMGLAVQNSDGSWSYSNPENWSIPSDHTAPCTYPWNYGFIGGALPST